MVELWHSQKFFSFLIGISIQRFKSIIFYYFEENKLIFGLMLNFWLDLYRKQNGYFFGGDFQIKSKRKGE